MPLVLPLGLACTGALQVLGALPLVVQEGRGLAWVVHIRYLVVAHDIRFAPASVASLAVEGEDNTGNSFLRLIKYRLEN